MKRARFTAPARAEFLAEVDFYETTQPGEGRRFVAAIEEATARAVAFPKAGSRHGTIARRVLVKDYPFSVVYVIEHEGIAIIAIAHHSRFPGYWRRRQ